MPDPATVVGLIVSETSAGPGVTDEDEEDELEDELEEEVDADELTELCEDDALEVLELDATLELDNVLTDDAEEL